MGERDHWTHDVLWLDGFPSPGAGQDQRVDWAQNMTAPVNIT